MRSVLWQQQFGNTGAFAIRLGLTEEPFSPPVQGPRSASWGTLELWVRGRCITAAHHDQIGDTSSIEWYLLEFSIHAPGCAPTIGINHESPRAGQAWSENMLLAHEPCHLLFDVGSDGVVSVLSGVWAEWPMEARANAFAAMLLMPDEGVRSFIDGRPVTGDVVRGFLEAFGVGVLAGTWHLKNRGFITEGQRLSLLLELGLRRKVDFRAVESDLTGTGT